MSKYEIIIIGGSAGAITGIEEILLEVDYQIKIPIVFLIHLNDNEDSGMVKLFSNRLNFKFKEADNYEKITGGKIYLAPPLYHLQIEQDKTFSLSTDEKVNFSRPSIDVLFETAAEVYQDKILGVILSGSSIDGAKGAKKIEAFGGDLIVVNPDTVIYNVMPTAAIKILTNPRVLKTIEIGKLINGLEAE